MELRHGSPSVDARPRYTYRDRGASRKSSARALTQHFVNSGKTGNFLHRQQKLPRVLTCRSPMGEPMLGSIDERGGLGSLHGRQRGRARRATRAAKRCQADLFRLIAR
jgi:hypothetical protein